MAIYYVLSIVKDLGFTKSEINPVVIKDDADFIVFDAGYPNQLDDFGNALVGIGYNVSDITKIVISHHDHDHIGSLKSFKEANPNIKVIASTIESFYITGKRKSLRLEQAQKYNENLSGEEKIFGEQFVNYLETINICSVDRLVSDNDYIANGVRVIATPGHTPGHISLYLEDEKVLLAGDALAVENGKLVLANPQFTLDNDEAINSIMKIKMLNPKKIICYHGNVFEKNIDEELRNILKETNA